MEYAVTPVEPAVRTPGQTIDHVVLGFLGPPREDDPGRAVGNVVAIAVRDKDNVRSIGDPRASKAKGEPGKVLAPIVEDGAFVMAAVTIAIFQDDNPILAQAGPFVVGVAFHHPESAAMVPGHGDRLADGRFMGEEGGLETVGKRHPMERFHRGGWFFTGSLGVAWLEIVRRARGQAQKDDDGREDAAHQFS